MNDIHHHCNAKSMGIINQRLELLRSTEARAESKEVRYLIAERSVVRMLLESHDLKRIISQFGNLREHICSELLKSSHLLLLCSHTDMALIDKRMLALARLRILPFIFLERIPHLRAECLCVRVLNSPCHICRDALSTAAFPLYI